MSVLSSINRAISSSREDIPNIEFVLSVNDIPEDPYVGHPMWTLTRRFDQESFWLMPDFGFWSWEIDQVGEYESVRDKMSSVETSFSQKIPQAVWIGATKTNPVRSKLMQVTKDQTWADVKEVRWSGRGMLSGATLRDVLPTWELCKYKYLIHTDQLRVYY